MSVNDLLSFWQSNLREYTFALLIVLSFYIFSRIFSLYIVRFLLFLTRKTSTGYDTKLVLAFTKPATLLLVALGFYFAGLYLLESIYYTAILHRLFRSILIILITSGFYNLSGTSSELFIKIGSAYDLDKLFMSLLSKTLRVILVAISFTILAQEWGYDVNGFVAGLGIGGLAFALAAQDTIANIFGGIVLLVEKPFTIGDWILSSDVEGTVEDITFRSTKVRTFAQALVTVPNSSLAKQPITNWTRMGRRRIMFHLGVTYTTPRDKLDRCVKGIRQMLRTHPEVHPDTIFANFDRFSESSLDIFIYCFTKTTVWGQWLNVKEDILFKIMEILENEGVSVAFPSRSIYFENSMSASSRTKQE